MSEAELEAKIKAGQDKFAGKEDAPLSPIPPEYTESRKIDIEIIYQPAKPQEPRVYNGEPILMLEAELTISELAEQQAREALMRDSVDRYQIVRDALENCLAQAQNMRHTPETAVEALRQIEILAVGALQK